jgi:putative ABC transport system ATP-binding protein
MIDVEKRPSAAGTAGSQPSVGALVTPPPAIQVVGLGRRDPKGDGWLIRDINFDLNPGDRLGVVGPSGAGKTVLMRAIAMLDPLDAGSIQWRGHVIRGEAVPAYRKHVIYLHQRSALWEGSVEDNLRYPYTLNAHAGETFDREHVVELLCDLGREPAFLAKSSRDLSGGEAQIVALVRAIQLEPIVLLLDEPTASLDPGTAEAVERLLDRWMGARDNVRALVFVSHDWNQTLRVTRRRLGLRSGQIEQEAGNGQAVP